MDTVIYSASPLQTYLTNFLTVAFLLVLSVVAIVAAVFRKSQGRGARIGMGVAGGFLLLVAIITCGLTLVSMTAGAQTITAPLKDKQAAQQSCGSDSDSTCTHYILSMESGAVAYDFEVPQSAFKQLEVGTCYKVTYHPNGGLFGNNGGDPGYVSTSYVSQIAQVTGGQCK